MSLPPNNHHRDSNHHRVTAHEVIEHGDAAIDAPPETIVGELQRQPTPTHRSSTTDSVDRVYDFHPGRVAVRIDGPDVMAVACDSTIDFVTARLVSPEGATELERTFGMFVGVHDGQSVFRIVLESHDDAKRYSTGWIQR